MRDDNKNLILAIALSVLVLLGWNYFYGTPQMERQRQMAQQAKTPATDNAQVPSTLPPGVPSAPGVTSSDLAASQSREDVLARSPRIVIDTPSLKGSISLKGGRVDDLLLKKYRETVDPQSPNITLFSPSGSAQPYYAEFGWAASQGIAVPTAQTLWTSDSNVLTSAKPVTLTYDNGQGLIFTRVIQLDDRAMFTVTQRIENKGSSAISLNPYGLISRHGRPVTQGFYVLHEGLTGYLGEQGLQEYTYANVDKEASFGAADLKGKKWTGVKTGFIGITDKYWAASLIPDQNITYDPRYSVSGLSAGKPIYQADLLGPSYTVEPQGQVENITRLFAGPKEVGLIDSYENTFNIKNFDRMIDWGWFYFITKPMFYMLDFFYHLLGNFGVAILLVTVVVKLLFLPLANRSYMSMAKMKAVQPEMMALREKYGDDRLKQQQELMALYKREKINPLAGCWPVLVQIPVFFALYKVLFVTIEMRHAPFFGWIRDLAAPDPSNIFNLFGLIPVTMPSLLHLGVWPLIMGITMFVQMKMNPEPPDPIQKTVFTWMPVIFTFMLASFPAGLVIYWAWNNFLSVTQQGYIMKKNGVKIELWDNIKSMFSRKPATS